MNISSYKILTRGESLGQIRYSLSLYYIYFLIENTLDLSDLGQPSSENLKQQGNSLVSLKKNKKLEQIAIFSDDEDQLLYNKLLYNKFIFLMMNIYVIIHSQYLLYLYRQAAFNTSFFSNFNFFMNTLQLLYYIAKILY